VVFGENNVSQITRQCIYFKIFVYVTVSSENRSYLGISQGPDVLIAKIRRYFFHPDLEMYVLSVWVRETGWNKMARVILAISIYCILNPFTKSQHVLNTCHSHLLH
jgi:hypothetical protein